MTMRRSIGLMVALVLGLSATARAQDEAAPTADRAATPAGTWAVVLGPFPASKALLQLESATTEDGATTWRGSWRSGDETLDVQEITWDAANGTLRFTCPDRETTFDGTLTNGVLKGTWRSASGAQVVRAQRPTATPDDLVGYWTFSAEFAGRTREALVSITLVDGTLRATSYSEMGTTDATDVELKGATLTFTQSLGGGMELTFSGTVTGDAITGAYASSFGTIPVAATRLDL